MAIFDRAPADWRDLQNLVGQLFTELGCEVEVGKRVQLVRGQKEIDVWAQDPHTSPASRYLCECKFWESRVDQEVVHSFRTVVSDYGAHRGFIVSKAGFQSGAREAAQHTNVDLLTFDELQQVFERRWRETMLERLLPLSDTLRKYWSPTGSVVPSGPWGPKEVEAHRLLTEACLPYVYVGLSRYGDKEVRLPVLAPMVGPDWNTVGQHEIRTERQYFDFLIREFDGLHEAFARLHGIDLAP